jgi:hypothetical protein
MPVERRNRPQRLYKFYDFAIFAEEWLCPQTSRFKNRSIVVLTSRNNHIPVLSQSCLPGVLSARCENISTVAAAENNP